MKTLILLLISFTAHANFLTQSDLDSCASGDPYTVYVERSVCESEKGVACLELVGDDCKVLDVVDVEVDDLESPRLGKINVEPCESEKACQLALVMKTCEESGPLISEDFSEVYCTKVIGYNQKTIKGLAVSEDKLEARNQAKAEAESIRSAKKEASREVLKTPVSSLTTIKSLRDRIEALEALLLE